MPADASDLYPASDIFRARALVGPDDYEAMYRR